MGETVNMAGRSQDYRNAQDVQWPGILAVESFQYVLNHGVSPNVAEITTYPQAAQPEEFGTLKWKGSGDRYLEIPGCRVKRMLGTYGAGGTTWVMHILDPRWQWCNNFGGLAAITGWYNRRDNRGELVPKWIRSPRELIELCLERMGVKRYRIRCPEGLSKKAGEKVNRRLFLGERYPPSGTNIEFVWDHTPPAEALTQVCQTYGLRVVYQPFSDLVIITPPGEGRALPDTPTPYEMHAPNIDVPETPVAVAAFGDNVRVQVRIPLIPIAEEWHGWPVDALLASYAPSITDAGQKQQSKITWENAADPPPDPIGIVITWTGPDGVGRRVEVLSYATTSIATVWANVTAQLDEYPEFASAFDVSSSGNDFNIDGKIDGMSFDVQVFRPDLEGGSGWKHTIEQVASETTTATWAYSAPPIFPNVRPTDRLSYMEARSLAAKSVFRLYRLGMYDPGKYGPAKITGGGSETSTSPGVSAEERAWANAPKPKVEGSVGSEVSTSWGGSRGEEKADRPGSPTVGEKSNGLWVPWYSEQYGRITDRELIILLPTKVEQVTPKPRIEGGQDRGNPVPASVASGILPEAYTGFSRDQEATVRGSVYSGLGNVNWMRVQEAEPGKKLATGDGIPVRPMNTRPTDRVYVPWTIVTLINGEQAIMFAEPVYKWNTQDDIYAKYEFPDLVLETSINVRHPKSGMPIRWEEFLGIPGGVSPIEWHKNEELKVGVVGVYDDNNYLRGWKYADGDLAYTKQAANFFLTGKAKKYYLKGGSTRQYPDILYLEPDGFIQQVSWSLSRQGPTTVASSNSEHCSFWPDYPHRIRAELLPPDKLAAQANMAERDWVKRFTPQPGKTTQ